MISVYPFQDNIRDTNDNLCALVRVLSSVSPSTKMRQLSRRLDREDQSGVLAVTVDPRAYNCAEQLRWDWLAANIARKSPSLRLPGVNPREAAVGTFLECEQRCKATNARLKGKYDTPTLGVSGDGLIETARLKILNLLGPCDADAAAAKFAFSSGASTRMGRSRGEAYFKYGGKPQVTPLAALAGLCAIWTVPVWKDRLQSLCGTDPFTWIKTIPGSRIDFVPKNAVTERTIAIEPDLNMHMQLGFGSLIRDALLKVGIDLNDQTINQEFARVGSISGSYATLDLKNASDNISIELVRRLLPADWFQWLDRLRSHVGLFPELDGSYQHLSETHWVFEKFSSMGNGFTFELETLIFWALSSSVVDSYGGSDRSVRVYGDDIIVPTACAGFVEELLLFCGFPLNIEKSFTAGPFRESCGKHFFRGIDVSPFACSGSLSDWADIYWLYNSLLYWPRTTVVDPRLNGLLYHLRNAVPSGKRCTVPSNFGFRQGFHSSQDDARFVSCTRTYGLTFWVLQNEVGFDVRVCGSRRYLAHMQDKSPGFVGDVHQEVSARGTVKYYKRYSRWVRKRVTSSTWSSPPLIADTLVS